MYFLMVVEDYYLGLFADFLFCVFFQVVPCWYQAVAMVPFDCSTFACPHTKPASSHGGSTAAISCGLTYTTGAVRWGGICRLSQAVSPAISVCGTRAGTIVACTTNGRRKFSRLWLYIRKLTFMPGKISCVCSNRLIF